ncbi:P-loop containing nucleoside triphosphate hydrolase protein [Blyttiomyces helicus]|uniref:P-loop containing nucleoside triphosphate hydrolase protein n=1 Tax=Blyttiomyces helicus TaxID=388810 RepID=A0A4P9VWS3_9FUNG|nr:P-loop containing nucleoside triphosphate hydrolase protein [Blyttiomyces helicus]|eukprot:RKO84169.1 P-loop containing nucleoside triphosphate hydrolase protein [Blyttiomyces helicus]
MFSGLGLFYVLILLRLVYQSRASQSTIDIVGTAFTAYVPSAGFVHLLFTIANFGPLRCGRATFELRDVSDATWFIFAALAAQIVVFFAWAVWRDSRSSASTGPAKAKSEDADSLLQSDADPDVVAEAARVDAGGANADAAVIRHLRKRYPPNADGREKIAVRNLSLGVPIGQCFALLGPNGAGKTTALSILAGEQLPSSGDCIVDGHSVVSDLAGVQASIGVTPQFDALLPTLTPREHFEMYAHLKGVPRHLVPATANALLKLLDLLPHADKQTQHLSGGNKRKTSVGIAVVGKPPCLMLDEPSTGMDPASKRSMWDVISALRKDHAIILTTHSMEEASSICNRIGIMTLGQLRCLGSIQHLRDRYGAGYQLEIQTRTDDTNLARRFVAQAFPGAVLLEYQRRHLRFSFPPHSVKSIADVFEIIEANRYAAGIDDYSLGQTSLEQVFLSFARDAENQADTNAAATPRPFRFFAESSRLRGSDCFLANLVFSTIGLGFVGGVSGLFGAMMAVISLFGIPAVPGILRLAWFSTFPYGSMPHDPRVTITRSSVARFFVNGIAILVTGPFAAMFHLLAAMLLAMTIWLYPYAKMHFKLVALLFTPAYW